jgi:hypothetical protein
VPHITDNEKKKIYKRNVEKFGCVLCGKRCFGTYCSSCAKDINSEEHPMWGRLRRVKGKYKLTLDLYNRLYELKDGRCHICGKPLALHLNTDGIEVASVDHNHETGAVRGLLCRLCNSMLGFARDDIGILSRAITYLEENSDE